MLSFITSTKERTCTCVEAKFCFGCDENARLTNQTPRAAISTSTRYARMVALSTGSDLAEMRPAFQVGERLLQRLERKRPIDHRLHLVLVDRAQHRFEAVAVADGNALQPHLARDHQPERRSERAARQDADHRQRPARPDAAQRLRQRLLAAKLNDVVVAAPAGDFARRLRPP